MHTLQITGNITAAEAIKAINDETNGEFHVVKTQIHGSKEFRAVIFNEYGHVVAIANIEG